ncbi:mannose-6-phosphate isomerase [Zafaria cholistanensis]|uniref:mannose-6-phosphate isomerase n=1 Tax=Zafaria cholistanensis TaxID=1682741 RepID=A0A5A7NV11_9MICC|nr:mannose-6-phosphate isomerase, class I [Zafaria cholistanensis]GER23848.1 mannose-6-phosphate isomerase [Zafaria cholistanensis]
MYRLSNTVRDYAWGSTDAIAGLLGRVPTGGPEAELWIGAHPGAPSVATAADGTSVPLDKLISSAPLSLLGAEAAGRFGRLPFLAKVLAAAKPLSLQVHPTLEQARAGFAAEEAAGVDPQSPRRNYKDDNHKPEMLYALTPFAALCGFRPVEEAASLFEALAGSLAGDTGTETAETETTGTGEALAAARHTAALLREGDRRAAFAFLLEAGDGVVPLVEAAAAAVGTDPALAATDPGLAELPSLAGHYPGDPGVLVSLMLNHVVLAPGQAMYLPAGNVHAYLRGLGIEVMASSDNVLRGGLTGKHIDLPELLATVDFTGLGVPLCTPEFSELGQELYRPPFSEFQLQRVAVPSPGQAAGNLAGGDVPLAQNGPLALVCVEGELLLDSPRGDLRVARGESVFIGADESPVIARPVDGHGALAFAFTVA